jgi:hypothetical protein
MKNIEINKQSLLIGIAVGVSIGVGAGIFGFSLLNHQPVQASKPAQVAAVVPPPLAALPINDPSTLVNTFPAQAAAAQQQAQMQQMQQMQMQQAQAAASYGQVDMTTTASGYPVVMSGSGAAVAAGNPYWTIGENGLIQNPCVDPPSCRGRAYSHPLQ